MIIGLVLISIGVVILVNPSLLSYIRIEAFDIYKFITDYSGFRIPLGLVSVLFGFFLVVFGLLDSLLVFISSDDITTPVQIKPWYIKRIMRIELSIKGYSEESLNKALCELDKFSHKLEDCKNFYFSGICSIPFLCKMGFILGDAAHKIEYLHYLRNKSIFKKLPFGNNRLKFSNSHENIGADELFVTVESSFRMSLDGISQYFRGMNSLHISTSEIGVDVINNKRKLNDFCEFIITSIREQANNVKRINIALCTSSLVAFALGQRISNTMDKEIVVYQYEAANSTNNRPWGIFINPLNNRVKQVVIPSH